MNAAHLHLLTNHLPLFAVLLGLLVGLYGAWRREESVVRVALMLFVLAALGATVAYFSGEAAEELVETLGRSEAALEAHEESGSLAAYLTIALGVFSLGTLVRRGPVAPAWRTALFVLALIVLGVVGYAANRGGRISHPEITGATLEETTRSPVPGPEAAEEAEEGHED